MGNKGGKELYLTKRFIMKTKRNIFIKQLLSNFSATLGSNFHNGASNYEGWGSTLIGLKIKKV